ncbi:DNA-binding protein, partial [Salmonella enterica]|nr:DNA-binding protein [Salmonella enterica]EAY3262913.1 DNA-binding protein [Salmonella enterica subsp. enterica serovar Enteritidis]EBB4751982.1 DNA-binding protein [Salmonella enterica subsp. enterica serovar Typhimurium]EBM7736649.1 helix-turn-helix domain-containing protein [Salmonella enterica subsp. enterica serovar Dublin]EDR1775919.1 helix-turn-helix domain-containing protein [Salmonella enterica subsp. enterica serovar 4,[5],12:i:-]EGW3522868.1 DNA-binding protein [Salmonella enteric
EIGGRRPKLSPEQWAQAGRLIGAGIPRQQVAIIYDVGLSIHGLYWILLSANRKGVKKRDYRAN